MGVSMFTYVGACLGMYVYMYAMEAQGCVYIGLCGGICMLWRPKALTFFTQAASLKQT